MYILYLHPAETASSHIFLPFDFFWIDPLFGIRLGSSWFFRSFGRLDPPWWCDFAPEVNFGTKVGKAPTTPRRRRHKGDRMEMGLAPEKKKARGRFSNERCGDFVFFFGGPNSLISLIPRSYAWNYGGFFLATFDVTAAKHTGIWLKNTTWDMSSMQCIAWAMFFWLPFPPWESPNTLLPRAKNDDSLHLPAFFHHQKTKPQKALP